MADEDDPKPKDRSNQQDRDSEGKEPRKMRGWMAGSEPGGDEKGPPTGGSGVSKAPGD